jgi:hypothetical protein
VFGCPHRHYFLDGRSRAAAGARCATHRRGRPGLSCADGWEHWSRSVCWPQQRRTSSLRVFRRPLWRSGRSGSCIVITGRGLKRPAHRHAREASRPDGDSTPHSFTHTFLASV